MRAPTSAATPTPPTATQATTQLPDPSPRNSAMHPAQIASQQRTRAGENPELALLSSRSAAQVHEQSHCHTCTDGPATKGNTKGMAISAELRKGIRQIGQAGSRCSPDIYKCFQTVGHSRQTARASGGGFGIIFVHTQPHLGTFVHICRPVLLRCPPLSEKSEISAAPPQASRSSS